VLMGTMRRSAVDGSKGNDVWGLPE